MRNRRRCLTGWLVCALLAGGSAVLGVPAGAGAAVARSAPAKTAQSAPAKKPVQPKATTPIKHVVVLYLEEHSFDSTFGFWCDEHRGRCPVGGLPAEVTLSNHVKIPPLVEPDVAPEVGNHVEGLERARANLWQWNGGCEMKKSYGCVGGWTAAQQPNTIALAEKFAINDDTFETTDTPSYGAHVVAVAGQSDGFTGETPGKLGSLAEGPGWGCDSDRSSTWGATVDAPFVESVPTCVPDRALEALTFPFGGAVQETPVPQVKTIMDSLEAADRSWKIFGDPEPLTEGKETPGYEFDICPLFAECLDTSQHEDNVQSSSFIGEAEAGNLPDFSLVVPAGATAADSEGAGQNITNGDDWIGEVANAVQNGPEWKSTALFITWDDCGCFYDQVKPGINPDGTQQGPRVPLIAVSPYAKHGFTDNTHATGDSILAFVEHDFGLPPLGVNEKGAYDLSSLFNFSQKTGA